LDFFLLILCDLDNTDLQVLISDFWNIWVAAIGFAVLLIWEVEILYILAGMMAV